MLPVTEVVTPDWDRREIIRTKSDATEERAAMEKGPEGFIIGKFETGVVTLDAPNLLLVPKIIKRPASEAAKKKSQQLQMELAQRIRWLGKMLMLLLLQNFGKRQSQNRQNISQDIYMYTNMPKQCECTSNVQCTFYILLKVFVHACCLQAVKSENYSVMWYKKNGNIGIREKFDSKKQVIGKPRLEKGSFLVKIRIGSFGEKVVSAKFVSAKFVSAKIVRKKSCRQFLGCTPNNKSSPPLQCSGQNKHHHHYFPI